GRSDRLACSTPCTTISSDGRGSFFESKSSPRCRRVDEDPVRGFGGSAKPGSVAGFKKTAKTPHAGRFPPPRRGPRRRSRLGLLSALDAAQRPSPPRPQRGPRRRRRPSPPSVPRPTPVPPTTWRLQPPSASLVLWRKPRNPSSVAACALDPGVDATAAARSELQSRLPFTSVHRTVHRPQHLHGSSPSTLDARVPT